MLAVLSTIRVSLRTESVRLRLLTNVMGLNRILYFPGASRWLLHIHSLNALSFDWESWSAKLAA